LREALVVAFLISERWLAVAGMYLAVTVTLSLIVQWMEHRFKVLT
jgi:ABC-type amino acid transport system permease subunit